MSTRTLLLTPWYMPIRVLRWEDAIKMIYEETVDVVASYDEDVRSPSVTWKMPAVVRLRRLPRGRGKSVIKFSRENVYQRDRHTCQYCGVRFAPALLSYDHVVPRSAGGRRTWSNIVTACRPCNLKKGSRTCDEVGMWPLTRPVQPKALPISAPRIDREAAPDEWQDFIGAWAR